MSDAYEEIIQMEAYPRLPPSLGHEILVGRLHRLVADAIPLNSLLRLQPPRTELHLDESNTVRPDLTVIRAPPGEAAQLYLVAEVLEPGDHHVDTVIKKQLWADARLPRFWMVDPRYLNVEVYGCGEYGFTLGDILAHHHPLTDPHLPGLNCPMEVLFARL